ncbi:hypothetical protein B9Z55_006760 [Caenorhabditis nigoni]|uniref:C6 domain-containing protein n=1 Tax=Caenorhabditis nigoni TaxID=1611254 RepID=A0A2G5V6L0_9PELO|nr:hypothetical protein B9Z55_006760 [Caenorhabditis nigoni]
MQLFILFLTFLTFSVYAIIQDNCQCPSFDPKPTGDILSRKQSDISHNFGRNYLEKNVKFEKRRGCFIEICCKFSSQNPSQNVIYLETNDGWMLSQSVKYISPYWPRLTCNGKRQWVYKGYELKNVACLAVFN